MVQTKRFFILIALVISTLEVYAAPILFNNALRFDNQSFGVVDFEGTQSSVSGIDAHLANFGAQTISVSGSIGSGIGGLASPISGSNMISAGAGSFGVSFDAPVRAAGAFIIGAEGGGGSPFSGDVATIIIVKSGNGSTTTFNYLDLFSPASPPASVNGFFGVLDEVNGISEITFVWNRDSSGIDDLYFANTTDDTVGNGPTNVPFSQIGTIPLPTFGNAVPEPSSWILLTLCGLFTLKSTKK